LPVNFGLQNIEKPNPGYTVWRAGRPKDISDYQDGGVQASYKEGQSIDRTYQKLKLKITKMKRLSFKKVIAALTFAIAGTGLVLASIEKADKHVEVQPSEPALFWYEVNLADNELGEQKNTSPLTKSQVLAMPSITSCDDTSSEICLRGYESEQNEGDPFIAPPTEEHRINTEQNP